jgi:hypothetical protein
MMSPKKVMAMPVFIHCTLSVRDTPIIINRTEEREKGG